MIVRLRTWSAQFNYGVGCRKRATSSSTRQSGKERARISFLRIKNPSVDQPQRSTRKRRSCSRQVAKILLIVAVKDNYAFQRIQFRVPLQIHAARGFGGEDDPGCVAHHFLFDSTVRLPNELFTRVIVFSYGIAKVSDPWLPRNTMKVIPNQESSWNWESGVDKLKVTTSQEGEAQGDCAEQPTDTTIRQSSPDQRFPFNGKMSFGVEGKYSMNLAGVWDLGQSPVVRLFISTLIHREHDRFPTKFRQVSAELQRAQHAAAANLRRKVKCHHEELFHAVATDSCSMSRV